MRNTFIFKSILKEFIQDLLKFFNNPKKNLSNFNKYLLLFFSKF